MAPGFIDMLGQSELSLLVDPHVPSKIFQGITTEITGEGGSAAPQTPRLITARFRYLRTLWREGGLDNLQRVLCTPGKTRHWD